MNIKNRIKSAGDKISFQTFCFLPHKKAMAPLLASALIMAGGASYAETQAKEAKPYPFTETRDMRFCEILVIKDGMVDIYNTSGLHNCPAELWDAFDPVEVAKELGADLVQKNGPKYWMMDAQTVALGETRSFAGVEARWAARIPASFLSKDKGSAPYEVFTTKKTQKMRYSKGKTVYELVTPEGEAYVLQAHGAKFPIESLATLGEQMTLPTGWQYRNRILEEDLVLDLTPDQTIYAVGDEFHQYYTLPPEAD
ncbi:MAG: hypothetical protein V3T55_08105 [Anaerolineales bacterium]